MKRVVLCLAAVALVLLGVCSRQREAPVLHLLAAASMTDALTEAARVFASERHVSVHCQFAASSALADQIVADVPCDLFVSADADWMDYLQKRDRIDVASRRDVASNRLVLVAPTARPFAFAWEGAAAGAGAKPLAEAFAGKLALAEPSLVPAGRYAKQALEKIGAWAALEARVIAAADVREALRLVERGEADAAIVFATEAKISKDAVTVATIPRELHAPIRYPAAALKGAPPTAAEFVRWLAETPGQAIMARFGFEKPAP